MKFDTQFKKKCFDVFQSSAVINELMTNLEANNEHKVRQIIEDYLDEVNRILKPEILIDDGERLIHNSKVKQFKRVHAIYSELMESINLELDSKIKESIYDNK